MSDAVIASIVAGVCAIIGSFVGQTIVAQKAMNNMVAEIKRASDITDAEIRGEIGVIRTEITELKEEVRRHNGVIERTYHLEKDVALHNERLTALERR